MPGLMHLEINSRMVCCVMGSVGCGRPYPTRVDRLGELLQLRTFLMPELKLSTHCTLRLFESPFLRHVQVGGQEASKYTSGGCS
jgi:hypothetical protein